MAPRFLTVAAFVSKADADALCAELGGNEIDAAVHESSTVGPADRDNAAVYEVQIAKADFDGARQVIEQGERPKLPRQFSLRATFAVVTVLCILSALVARFGVVASFWGVVFTSMGTISIVIGVVFFRRGRASWAWPLTPGTIVRASIDWDGENYRPQIKFRFAVDGREYTADTVAYMASDVSGSRAGHEAARRAIVRYPNGLAVDVFYDPLRPAHAVLERGSKIGDAALAIGAGLAFILFGGLMFLGVLPPG